METPACPRPNDTAQEEILDQLVIIRDKLLLLKRDHSTYIRIQDVMPLYEEFIDRIRALSDICSEPAPGGVTQLDKVMESCFQLLSLSFMAMGKNNETPAALGLTTTIKRLLDQLVEANNLFYSHADLARLESTIQKLQHVANNDGPHKCQCRPQILVDLLNSRIAQLRNSMATLEQRLAKLQGDLPKVHIELIDILRSTSFENTKPRFVPSEVVKLREKLQAIDARRVDGAFVDDQGNAVEGSDDLGAVLKFCTEWTDLVLERQGVIPESFRGTYDALNRVRNALMKLMVTQTWSMRETDLYDFQRELDRWDATRVNGRWVDEDGVEADNYVQWTLLYLLRRSYAAIYELLSDTKPVSEALMPVYVQLQSLKRCLAEVQKNGGLDSARELYPYSMKLKFIEDKKKDGVFKVGDDVPGGQEALAALVQECCQVMKQLSQEAGQHRRASEQEEPEVIAGEIETN